ncbi:MAG: DegT/DnrJ/EryC1/StrS family aminotransferase [Alphaproteobacteria bacterium]
MLDKPIPIAKPHFAGETQDAILRDMKGVFQSGRLLDGPFAEKLESFWASETRRAYAVAIDTCTTALTVVCLYFGVKGKDVLVPAASFITDATAVLNAGGNPVLVDVDPETLSFDLQDLQRKTGPNTAGIIWVHLTGMIARNHAEIVGHCRRNGLFIIEDAAHAHGAELGGRPAGSFGDVACFSFYATKVVTSGTGGIAVTDDPKLARFLKQYRSFGKDPESGLVTAVSGDHHLDEIRCCVAYHQSGDMKRQVAARRDIARRYEDGLRNQPHIHLIDPGPDGQPSYYQFPIMVDSRENATRLSAALAAKHGIQAKKIYLPLHEEVVFRHMDTGSLKQAEDAMHRSLCLPVWVGLSQQDIERVIAAVTAEVQTL